MSTDTSNHDVAIWGGRWQPPHIGHEWVFKQLLRLYKNVCIAIVNPDPNNPPVPHDTFPRFGREFNPLSYFERLKLWTLIAEASGALSRVVIVPTWHPRKKIVLENTFFPPHARRIWAVPMQAEEEIMKVQDFTQLGERTCCDFLVPQAVLGVSGSDIRHRLESGTSWIEMLPQSIREFGASVVRGGIPHKTTSVLIPILNDFPKQNQFALLRSLLAQNVAPIFALGVHVNESNDWWFQPERDSLVLCFYERYRLITHVITSLNIAQPYIIPLFYTESGVTLYEAFMPPRLTRKWLIDSDDEYSGWILTSLLRYGEELLPSASYDRRTAEQAEVLLKDELSKVYYESRAKGQQHHRRKKTMSGINIGDGTTIHGNVVGGEARVEGNVQNVEGDQVNISATDVVNVRKGVESLLRAALDGSEEDISLEAGNLERTTNHLQPAHIESIVKQAVGEFITAHEAEKSRLRERMESFVISAGGSGVVTGIVEVLRLLLGG